MTPHEARGLSNLPTYVPGERVRDDLELLCTGALAPSTGFEGAGGLVTLEVPDSLAADAVAAGGMVLLDPEGARRAIVRPASTYPAGSGRTGIVGAVEALPYDGSLPFARLRRSPAEVREAHGGSYLLVPVDRPLTRDDLATVSAKAAGSPVVLLVLNGAATTGLAPSALVRATLAAAELLPRASVVVVPVRRRGDASDSALVQRVVNSYTVADVAWPAGEGFLPAEVDAVVAGAGSASGRRGLVLFFTGLSGSGKSTVARAVQDVLLERHDREVTSLDGDVVRRNLSEGLTFSAEDRDRNIRRIGWVAAEIARHGGVAVASPIAPFDATRRDVRLLVEEAGGSFVLVHVATPLEECERRDRKGLYAKARAGEIPDFTGVSSPYEDPADAEVRIDTTDLTVAEAAHAVVEHLAAHGHLTGGARG